MTKEKLKMKKMKFTLLSILVLSLLITAIPITQVQAASQKKWEKAYLKEIGKLKKSIDKQYESLTQDIESQCISKLEYIDNDNIPELIITVPVGSCGSSWILTYYNGKVKCKEFGPYIYYTHKKGIIRDEFSHSGTSNATIYKLKKGKFIKKTEWSYFFDEELNKSGKDEVSITSYKNGKEISSNYYIGKKAQKELKKIDNYNYSGDTDACKDFIALKDMKKKLAHK